MATRMKDLIAGKGKQDQVAFRGRSCPAFCTSQWIREMA